GVAGSDAVIENETAVAQQRTQPREIDRQVLQADVFKHADTGNLVEAALFRHVAIILQPDFAAAFESLLPDLATDVVVLVLRQRDAHRAGTELLDRAEDQRAPAASDIEQ